MELTFRFRVMSPNPSPGGAVIETPDGKKLIACVEPCNGVEYVDFYACELTRRWNAYEPGGAVAHLVASAGLLAAGDNSHMAKQVRAAIARVEAATEREGVTR